MRVIKKTAKILAIIVGCIILLNIVIVLAFTIPRVQQYAAEFALSKLKPILKTELSIEKLRLRGFNSATITGLYVEDQQGDTLLYAKKVSAKVNVVDLLKNSLAIQSASISNFTGNVYRQTPETPFNFQFIIDAFAPDPDKEKKPSENPMMISISNIKLTNGDLRYNILSEPETPGLFNVSHFDVVNFSMSADITSLDMKNLVADIGSLNFYEKNADIHVDNLQAMVRSKGNKLWSDKVDLKFNNSAIEIPKASYDTELKKFELNVKSSKIEPKDISIFTNQFSHLDKAFELEAELDGQLPSVNVKNLTAKYGNQTSLQLKGFIDDYSKYQASDIDISVNYLKTNIDDLQSLIRIGAPELELPQQVLALEEVDLNLTAKGKLNNFKINMLLGTTPGDVRFDGSGRIQNEFKNISIEGVLSASDLKVAKIIGEEIGVDDVTLNTFAQLTITPNSDISVKTKGKIESVTYNNFKYTNISIDGLYSGNDISGVVSTDTEQNKFNLAVDLSLGKPMSFVVNGSIDKLFLTPIFTLEGWQNPYLMAQIDANLQGDDIDSMQGTMVIDGVSLYDDNFIYNPGTISLEAGQDEDSGIKKIQISSSVLDAQIEGDYYLTTIGNEIKNLLSHHLPTLIKSPETEQKTENNVFTFDLVLKNTEDLSYALSLPFINVEPGTLSGKLDMANGSSLVINGHIPRVKIGENDIRETKFDLISGEYSGIKFNTNTYLVQDNGYVNARLNVLAANDSVTNGILFDLVSDETNANGDMGISASFSRDEEDKLITNVNIHPSNFWFNQELVRMPQSTVVIEEGRIGINKFSLEQRGMLLLGIDGVLSKKQDDSVVLYFNDTELGNILTAVNAPQLKGSIDGAITINQALFEPKIETKDLKIENLRTATDTLGTLSLNGSWDRTREGLDIDMSLVKNNVNYLFIEGYIPTEKTIPMDIDLHINKLPLEWIQPFTVDIFSQLSGSLNSKINLSGHLSAPVTEGWLGIDEGVMTVAYTNATYTVSDTINILPGSIGMNNLVIKDNNNHEAHLKVALTHRNFKGMEYQINLKLNDFLLLNNDSRTDMIAYGNLKLSGDINIVGSSRGIFGNANLRNESRSNVMIEIPQTATAAKNSGIIYVDRNIQEEDSLSFLRKTEGGVNTINTKISNSMPIRMQAVLHINDMLEAGVLINPVSGDMFQINGDGELRAVFDSQANPAVRLYGDYVAESGRFKYNFLNFKAINFKIKEGSTVTLVGDPLNTQFNISAYNEVNTNLATLSESFVTQMANTRVPVHAKLDIQGNLDRMNLQYGIELPDVADDVRQRFNSLVSTDEQKITQFANLIATGSFYPAGGTLGGNFNESAFTNYAASALTRGLDALLASALSDDWSISTNIETADGNFDSMRMGVGISKSFLDNRLRISSNLSYGDKSMMASQQAFMGEFELEYDINNWLMIRAYNRANKQYYNRAPTTQGVGLVINRDARRFKDLFKFSFRRREYDY